MTALPKAERADLARSRILTAARQRFSVEGFDRTTIRAVAADARIDASMVMRYFGSKEGLFAAAVDVDLALPDVRDVPREDLGRVLAQHFVDRWESDDTGPPLRVLLSCALTDAAAATRMAEVFTSQLTPALDAADLLDRADAGTRAALIASQVLGFALCRYVLRLPPAVALQPQEVIHWLAPTLQRYLDPR